MAIGVSFVRNLVKSWRCRALVNAAVLSLFAFCSAGVAFNVSRATLIVDRDGALLGALIAKDGQWRFPNVDSVPYKFEQCLLHFEDRHFYEHNGVHLASLCRATVQNIQAKEVVSGGSTITMQVVRMARGDRPRTVSNKLIETCQALRLECGMSKKDILALYANNAPFGGNVVGVQAAAWRYFSRPAESLSWAESATLAVLPNAPALIHPGRNRDLLLKKRNRVLLLLLNAGVMDSTDYNLALSELLPEKPYPLPQFAQHLLHTTAHLYGSGKAHHTTISSFLQQQVVRLVDQHKPVWNANNVQHAAVVVIHVPSGEVRAYVGNTAPGGKQYGDQVDVVQAPRSTGSILKPLLYAAMLDDAKILPNSLVPDIPISLDGFTPQNFAETFDGAVPAARALARSLNVPAVMMLKEYNYARFHYLLKRFRLEHFTKSADHYGLSLILGGGEATLWEVAQAYSVLANQLNTFPSAGNTAQSYTVHWVHEAKGTDSWPPVLSSGSLFTMFNALVEVNRPEEEYGWEEYSSSSPIAWKTGTSFGNRDAWAVGTTPEYVVGVWVGNADGSGRPELTGINAAAPLMFDVFDVLPNTSWWIPPASDMRIAVVCSQSGKLATKHCLHQDTIFVPSACEHGPICDAHILIHLDATGSRRVNANCYTASSMIQKQWFHLPPVQAWYYAKRHPDYLPLPEWEEGCFDHNEDAMAWIYPKGSGVLSLPVSKSGAKGKIVLEIAHRHANAVLHWHLDQKYLGTTQTWHQMEIEPESGEHTIYVTDESGHEMIRQIKVR